MNTDFTKSVPVGGTNAIESAIFAVKLTGPVDPDFMGKIDAAIDALGDELPGKITTQGMSFPALQGGFVPISVPFVPMGELTRFHAKSNGSHTWRVTVQGQVLVVACHAYTSYPAVWDRAKKYFELLLAHAPVSDQFIEASLQVVDKFHYRATQGSLVYDMRELFRENTPFLTASAWDKDVLWHVYQGWFDRSEASFKRLSQLNLSNIRLDDGTFSTVIDHRQVTSEANDGIMTLNVSDLEGVFDRHHEANRDVIERLLTDEKLKEIGIGEKK